MNLYNIQNLKSPGTCCLAIKWILVMPPSLLHMLNLCSGILVLIDLLLPIYNKLQGHCIKYTIFFVLHFGKKSEAYHKTLGMYEFFNFYWNRTLQAMSILEVTCHFSSLVYSFNIRTDKSIFHTFRGFLKPVCGLFYI